MTVDSGVAGAVDDYVASANLMPINRQFGAAVAGSGLVQVLEFLKVYWYINVEDASDISARSFAYLAPIRKRANATTATPASFVADLAEPDVFAAVWSDKGSTTTGAYYTFMPYVMDLTDEAGNGLLFFGDRVWVHFGAIANTAVGSAKAKILYRFVNVAMEEFVTATASGGPTIVTS